MAKDQKKKESPFIKFNEIGDEITGLFNGFQKAKAFPNQPPGLAVKIGEKLVGISASLKNQLRTVQGGLIMGKTKIKIEYVGESEKLYYGKPTHLYELTIDGKKVEPTFDATAEDVDKFFNS
jgi:hypothetical protein